MRFLAILTMVRLSHRRPLRITPKVLMASGMHTLRVVTSITAQHEFLLGHTMRCVNRRTISILSVVVTLLCGTVLAQNEQTPGDPWASATQRIEALEAEIATLRQHCNGTVSSSTSIDCIRPGLSASVDYLNWTLQRRGLDFAIPTDDTALAVGVGQVQSVQFKPDSGFRTGLGYMTASGWELSFRYTSFDTSADASAADVGGNLWATRTHPDRGEEAVTADAFSDFDYDVFDLEIQRWVMVHRTTAIGIMGGFRWADVSQNLRIDYDGRDFDQTVFQNPVDLTGFGVRLGGEGHWRITNCFSLFGRAAGTVMQGDFTTRLLETNFAGTEVVVDVTDVFTNTLTAMELAAGISWNRGPLSLSGGYEMTNWSNLGERTTFSSEAHEGAYDPSSVDVLLEGLFIRGAWLF